MKPGLWKANSFRIIIIYLLRDGYGDLEDKMNRYITYPEEAQSIIHSANLYVEQLKDKKTENWLSLKVLEKYFETSGQL